MIVAAAVAAGLARSGSADVPSGWKFWPEKEPGPVDDAYVQVQWVRPYRPGPLRLRRHVLIAVVRGLHRVRRASSPSSPSGHRLGQGICSTWRSPSSSPARSPCSARASCRSASGSTTAGVRVLGLVRNEHLAGPQSRTCAACLDAPGSWGSPMRSTGTQCGWSWSTAATARRRSPTPARLPGPGRGVRHGRGSRRALVRGDPRTRRRDGRPHTPSRGSMPDGEPGSAGDARARRAARRA